MVVGDEQQADNVGHSQTDKGYGTAESSSDSGQYAGDYEQPVAYTQDIDAKVFGVTVTQQQRIERFDEDNGS